MNATIPELLRSLAAVFATAGPFPRTGLEAGAQAFWASPGLKDAILRLLATAGPDWPEVWADHFLVSRDHPVLHLEASVHRTGLLSDPALLQDLDLHYAVLGFEAPGGRGADHLASELEALAAGLDRLRSTDEVWLETLVPHLASLLDLHLRPLLEELARLARHRPCHSAITAALTAASASVDLVRDGIYAFA